MNVPVSSEKLEADKTSALAKSQSALWIRSEWRAAGRLLARRQLSLGRPDLSLRKSDAARAAETGARQAAGGRALGHDAGAEFHLRPSQSSDQAARSRHDLYRRARARRPGPGRQHLSRRQLQRDLSRHQPGRSRDEAAVQAVLVPRRHFEPCRADDARLDPRGRRTRLFAQPRLRRRVRQSRVDRRLHRRRRRGRDRAPWRPLGSPTSFSIRSPTARCCRSCISTASRSAIRRSSPASSTRNWRSSSRVAAGRRCSSRATSPR